MKAIKSKWTLTQHKKAATELTKARQALNRVTVLIWENEPKSSPRQRLIRTLNRNLSTMRSLLDNCLYDIPVKQLKDTKLGSVYYKH